MTASHRFANRRWLLLLGHPEFFKLWTGQAISSLGSSITMLLTAPVTIAFDALSFLLSAGCSLLIRVTSNTSAAAGRPIRLRSEIVEGLRVLFGSKILSSIAVSATVGALAGAMQAPLVILYLVRELYLSPALVGLAVTATGVASVAGALLAPVYSQRIGLGPAYISGQLFASLAGFALAAASASMAVVAPFVILGQLLRGLGPPLYGVAQTTLRQTIVPDHLLGRVNATWRFLVFGAQPLGALLGGGLGAVLGLRAALMLSSLGVLVGFLSAARSPLRSLRHLPT